jgi:hypothetical protein
MAYCLARRSLSPPSQSSSPAQSSARPHKPQRPITPNIIFTSRIKYASLSELDVSSGHLSEALQQEERSH